MPTYVVDVGPAVVNPTHHVSLIAEDGTEIGLILCDASGDRLTTAIARSNLQTSPIKTSTGDSQYSDGEPPFVVSPQSDYSGGIGQERFEDNRTKYHSGRRVQNVEGNIVLGPREHYTTGYKEMVVMQPPEGGTVEGRGNIGRLKWLTTDSPNAISTRFETDAAGLTFEEIYFYCKPIGSPTGPDEDNDNSHVMHWEVNNNDAGGSEPGTVLGSGTLMVPTIEGGVPFMRWEEVSGEDTFPNLAASTTYWFTLQPNSNATTTTHVELGFHYQPSIAGVGASVISSDGGASWGGFPDADYQLMFRFEEIEFSDPVFLQHYRNQLYCMTRPTSAAPILLMNGWRGVCDSNAGDLNELVDATQTGWADDAAAGGLVWVFAGPGAEEEFPFRRISASASGVLTIVDTWRIAHTTDTEYVVLGTNLWFPITHTIPIPATGPWAVAVGGTPPDDEQTIAYIPLGHESNAIWMFRQVNVGGVMVTETKSINDATGGAGNFRCKYMVTVQDDTLGPILVKCEDNRSSGSTGLVAEARVPGTWTAQAAWGGDEQLGDAEHSGMTGAIEYVNTGNDARNVWCFSRGELFGRATGAIPGLWAAPLLPELKAFASERTAKVTAVFNTALYLSLAGGLLERLTGGNVLTDVGPTLGVGLPERRVGEIEALVSYPGQLFVATSPPVGATMFSTVTRLRGLDSHDPIYETGNNRRITAMISQRIPARVGLFGPASRLWIHEGNSLVWIDLPTQGLNPITDPNYQFCGEGFVSSSRIYANLDDRRKVFSSLKVISDSLLSTTGTGRPQATRWIDPLYQLDTDDDSGNWTAAFGGRLTVSPSQEIFLTNYTPDQVVPLRGRFLRVRQALNSITDVTSPVVRAQLLESLVHQPAKYAFNLTVLFEDNQLDLLDHQVPSPGPSGDLFTLAWRQAGQLEEFAEQMEVFTMRAPSSTLDNAKVIIATPEVAPIGISTDTVTTEEGRTTEKLIGTLSIIQVTLPDLGLVT